VDNSEHLDRDVLVTGGAGDEAYKDTDDGDMKASARLKKTRVFCPQLIVRPRIQALTDRPHSPAPGKLARSGKRETAWPLAA
jgi:hypothetical protein